MSKLFLRFQGFSESFCLHTCGYPLMWFVQFSCSQKYDPFAQQYIWRLSYILKLQNSVFTGKN